MSKTDGIFIYKNMKFFDHEHLVRYFLGSCPGEQQEFLEGYKKSFIYNPTALLKYASESCAPKAYLELKEIFNKGTNMTSVTELEYQSVKMRLASAELSLQQSESRVANRAEKIIAMRNAHDLTKQDLDRAQTDANMAIRKLNEFQMEKVLWQNRLSSTEKHYLEMFRENIKLCAEIDRGVHDQN